MWVLRTLFSLSCSFADFQLRFQLFLRIVSLRSANLFWILSAFLHAAVMVALVRWKKTVLGIGVSIQVVTFFLLQWPRVMLRNKPLTIVWNLRPRELIMVEWLRIWVLLFETLDQSTQDSHFGFVCGFVWWTILLLFR